MSTFDADHDDRLPAEAPEKPRRLRRWLARGIVALLVLLVFAEVVSRFFGLGNPPLYVSDDQIEYMPRPSSAYRRFGRRTAYNAYSMRSDELTPAKQDPGELRVMVLGDSVINGGAIIDQNDVATERLRRRLSAVLGTDVYVGNISCGSWGPGNLLAYVKRFGLFDADVVVIELNGPDYGDVPTFAPIVGTPAFPDKRPVFALSELFAKYGPRYLRLWTRGSKRPGARAEGAGQEVVEKSLAALRELLGMAQDSGATVFVAQYLMRAEAESRKPHKGHAAFAEVAGQMGVATIQLGPAFSDALDAGQVPYIGPIHPDAEGQKLIADALFEPVLRALEERRQRH